jgi:hypothetical protein
MRIKILSIVLIVILSIMSVTACAQKANGGNKSNRVTATGVDITNKEQLGNVLFVAPSGWERLETNGKLVFVAPNSNQNTVIAILPGEEFSGNLETYFRQFLANNRSNSELVAGGQIAKGSSDEGYQVLYVEEALKASDGGISYRLYIASHPRNRAEVIALISTDQKQYQQYLQTFQGFAQSLDFVNIKNGETPNSKSDNRTTNKKNNSGNGFNGLYVGTISRQQFNPNTHYYDYIVRQQYYLFSSDGRVYFGLPKADIRDLETACQQDPDNCGQYQLQGSQLQLLRQGQEQSFNLQPTNNGFKLGNTAFYPVHSFDGLRLNGTYSFRSFSNLSGGAGGIIGGVSGEKTISFSSDGRFVANNFVGFTGSGSVAGATSSSSISGEGTYQIQGNSLILNSNGRQQTLSFFVYPENEKEARPGYIVVGGAGYLLRN